MRSETRCDGIMHESNAKTGTKRMNEMDMNEHEKVTQSTVGNLRAKVLWHEPFRLLSWGELTWCFIICFGRFTQTLWHHRRPSVSVHCLHGPTKFYENVWLIVSQQHFFTSSGPETYIQLKKNEILLMSNYVRRRRSVCDLRFVSGLIKNFIHSKRRH